MILEFRNPESHPWEIQAEAENLWTTRSDVPVSNVEASNHQVAVIVIWPYDKTRQWWKKITIAAKNSLLAIQNIYSMKFIYEDLEPVSW